MVVKVTCCPQAEKSSSYRIKHCGSSLTSDTWREKMRPCLWNVFTFLVILNTGRWKKSKNWRALTVLLGSPQWNPSRVSTVCLAEAVKTNGTTCYAISRYWEHLCWCVFLDTAEINLLPFSVCQVTTWFRSDATSSSDLLQTWKKEQQKEDSFSFQLCTE